jgi:tetratricopeptide (TPR) repeat protein
MPPLPLRIARLLLAAIAAGFVIPAAADTLQDISRLAKQGQHAQAIEQVDKYLAGKPKDAQGRFLKGLILTEMNRPTEAIAIFQKLSEDYPELPEPYNNLAVVYAQQKQYDKARQALEMAIRTHPAYATAHENLGDIYARLASQAYDKALQLDSSNTSAQTKLSMIRDLMGGNRPGKAGTPIVVATADSGEIKGTESRPTAAKPPVDIRPIEPAKPVDVKPVEPTKSGEAKPPTKASAADARKAVEDWAAAWSRKDVAGYLAFYAKDFQVPGGVSRQAWESERKARLTKPGAIEVSVESLKVTAEGTDRATAQFRQSYKSANLKTSGNKTLVLVRQNGGWLIQQEKVGR